MIRFSRMAPLAAACSSSYPSAQASPQPPPRPPRLRLPQARPPPKLRPPRKPRRKWEGSKGQAQVKHPKHHAGGVKEHSATASQAAQPAMPSQQSPRSPSNRSGRPKRDAGRSRRVATASRWRSSDPCSSAALSLSPRNQSARVESRE